MIIPSAGLQEWRGDKQHCLCIRGAERRALRRRSRHDTRSDDQGHLCLMANCRNTSAWGSEVAGFRRTATVVKYSDGTRTIEAGATHGRARRRRLPPTSIAAISAGS